ncbi:hypothetical protein [Asticcacaulis sp. AND118]|uniref:hypothetical protein n=1 Tax=Asticcacaulis sp. AND118 TaxID=2840468 RepID=UPI001CFF647E|nr:hypothetical protein [Asticcacaulis sp. AND118]UDF04695.1 hypothetical protein LH365_06550 [Asticcacaulis sp. AND118]
MEPGRKAGFFMFGGTVKRAIGFVVWLLLACGSAHALSQGELNSFVEPADVAGYPDMKLRNAHPHLYLKDEGDFDGDGQAERVVFWKTDQGRVYIASHLTGSYFQELPTGTLSLSKDMPRMGLRTVKPGVYKTACVKGYGKTNVKCVKSVTLKRDAIEVFTFEAASTLYVWNGKAFDVYPLSD